MLTFCYLLTKLLFAPIDGSLLHQASVAGSPVQTPREVRVALATWLTELDYRPDVLHDGNKIAGIRGRLYLFGEDIDYPFYAEGAAAVEVQMEASGPSGEPVVLERWKLDGEALRKCQRKDLLGDGYTLWLPWGNDHSDVERIRMKIRFDQPGLPPLYYDGGYFAVERPRSGS